MYEVRRIKRWRGGGGGKSYKLNTVSTSSTKVSLVELKEENNLHRARFSKNLPKKIRIKILKLKQKALKM